MRDLFRHLYFQQVFKDSKKNGDASAALSSFTGLQIHHPARITKNSRVHLTPLGVIIRTEVTSFTRLAGSKIVLLSNQDRGGWLP